MPIYAYSCESCNLEMELDHGMSEKENDCPICRAADCLVRIPSLFFSSPKIEESNSPPGTIVKSHIKEAQEELKEYKKEMKKSIDK